MKKLIPINLRFFSEENVDTTSPNNGENNENHNPPTPPNNEETNKPSITITNEILHSLLEDTRKKAIEEALALSKMTEDQQKAYAQEQRIKDLELKEKELISKELKLQALNMIEENSLDKSFADLIVSKDLESTKENIKTLKTVFDKAVQDGITKAIAGKTPPIGNNSELPTSNSGFLQTILDNQAKRS